MNAPTQLYKKMWDTTLLLLQHFIASHTADCFRNLLFKVVGCCSFAARKIASTNSISEACLCDILAL